MKKKTLLWGLGIFVLMLLLLPFLVMYFYAKGRMYERVEEVSPAPVAIVFGAAAYRSGPSDAFGDRLLTAAELYHAGKAQKILISGDNSTVDYNEPQTGKNFLLEYGIPGEAIQLDNAGFRTYDTCARAKKVFLVDEAIVVSQRFHLPRILFTCGMLGIEVEGVVADKQSYQNHWYNLLRETAAQWILFYEVTIFPHDPKYLGEEIPLF